MAGPLTQANDHSPAKRRRRRLLPWGGITALTFQLLGSRRHNRGLLVIAIYKWCTALLCAVLGLGLLKLLHQDVGDVAERLIRSLRGDPDNHLLAKLLGKLSLIEDPQLAKLSAASFGYAALFLVEGTGLYYEQRWAKYLTVVATASLVPLEIYELIKSVDVLKISILAVNLAIIVFLVITIRNKDHSAN